MKRLLLILGMVTCLASLSACQTKSSAEELSVDPSAVREAADYYRGVVDNLAMSGENLEDYADQIEQYYGISASVILPAAENYKIAMDDLGSYVSTQDVTYTEEKGILTITSTIVGSKPDKSGNPRTAEFIVELKLPNGELKSVLTNVNYSFKELMTNAALNTILGMGTVFVVLIILMFIISLFKIVNNMQNKANEKSAAEKAVTDSVDKAVAQIEKNEEVSDDTELIAVIAAAIAASEGAASADGYVVRSIRRRY